MYLIFANIPCIEKNRGLFGARRSNAAVRYQRPAIEFEVQTYVLRDGIVNSGTINLDVEFSEAERRRTFSEYGRVPSTYALAFNPNCGIRCRAPALSAVKTARQDYSIRTQPRRTQDLRVPARPDTPHSST